MPPCKPTGRGLIALTPLVQSEEHNVIRISRACELSQEDVLHIAGGEHTGIIVNRLGTEKPSDECDVALSFCVWLRDGELKKQERRLLRFRFYEDIELSEKHASAQRFFKDLVSSFPKDYVSFWKRILKLMQNDYGALYEVEVDAEFVREEEKIQMPDPKAYDSGSEVEDVTVGHVQEVLEHAYPNGLSVEVIAEAMRCSVEEVMVFLKELEVAGIAKQLQNEWIRVDTLNIGGSASNSSTSAKEMSPTVAIVTCLFVEKQAIDSIITDSTTVHRYRSGGDSNIYTLGWIGKQRVVATKLAVIGESREATTSAGSITTRLLGNFQNVEHVFVVGVGGGVPHYTDAKRHVRLGDVVVSSSAPNSYVYAYSYTVDRNNDTVNGFIVRRWSPKDEIIANIAEHLDDDAIKEWNETTEATIKQLNNSSMDVNFSRPPPESDVLALPVGGGNVVVIPHPNQERNESTVHVGPIGAMIPIRKGFGGDGQPGEDTIRDFTTQSSDRFAVEYNLRSIDAGFDSVVAAISGSRIDSWSLVRGIADYQHGQSRAARTWQAYAAVRAAALVKSLVLRLPVSVPGDY